jgi:sialic acid synthase SpsE
MANPMLAPAHEIQTPSTIIHCNGAYIIAEMACAHDGDFEKACALIDVAVSAKTDAVQFQFFHAPANMVKHHRIYPLLEKIEFSAEQWASLVQRARTQGIDVFACAYDMPSLELAISLQVDGIKFNSADLNNFEMLETVAASGIPFTLGTGASRMDEIGQAIAVSLAAGGNRFILMHGMQSFPTSIDLANIRRISALSSMFGALVGYADHTDGDNTFAQDIDLLAMGTGACVFEKHYTLNRAEKGTDYQAALNPNELANFVSKIRQANIALGSARVQKFNEDEIRYRTFQKKRLVAAHALKAGHVLARIDIALLRTEDTGGLDASALASILGKKLTSDITENSLFGTEHLS